MDFRRKFEFGLAWRTLVLIAAIWLFSVSLDTPDIRAGRIVAGLVALLLKASAAALAGRYATDYLLLEHEGPKYIRFAREATP